MELTTTQSATADLLITDESGCFFDNGYLEHIGGSKYKPMCQNGFDLRIEIKTLKCKNGKMSANPECVASVTTTTLGLVTRVLVKN